MTTPARDFTADLNKAVDGLIKPRRTRLLRDDGSADWTTVPSAWEQLKTADRNRTDRGQHGVPESRPPMDLEVMEIRYTIREMIIDALQAHEQPTAGSIPELVRRLAATILTTGDDDLIDWWTRQFGSFTRWIGTCLHLHDEPQPRGIRGAQCPACLADHVTRSVEGETIRSPALIIDFHGQHVRAASCQMCGAVFWRGNDLLQLAAALGTLDAADAAPRHTA